jgi:hypothetical protein
MQTAEELVLRFGIFYFLILVGYAFGRMSSHAPSVNKSLTSLLLNLFLPLLVLQSLLTASAQTMSEVPAVAMLAVLAHLLGLLIAWVVFRTPPLEKRAKGALMLSVAFSNAIFLPVPLVLIFIGPEGIPAVTFFTVTQLCILAFVGPVVGSVYGGKPDWRFAVKKTLLFPPLLAVFAALALAALGVVLPSVVQSVLSVNGTVTTYLALFEVGIGVGHRFSLFDIRNALEAVAIRQLILPAIIIVIVVFLGLSEITTKVMILEALMPSAVTVVIYAAGLGLDSELAATVVTLGTFLLLPVIPLLPILLA